MAVPARKVSKTRGATRRAHMALTKKETTKCPNCGATIKSHRVCPECGYYKNNQVIKDKTEEVASTKEEKKAKKTKKEN